MTDGMGDYCLCFKTTDVQLFFFKMEEQLYSIPLPYVMLNSFRKTIWFDKFEGLHVFCWLTA